MCEVIPLQHLEQRPDDAAEDHGPAQPRAVCKDFMLQKYVHFQKLFISRGIGFLWESR